MKHSSQEADLRRRTTELIRTTNSYLSVKLSSRRSCDSCPSNTKSPRTSIARHRKAQTEGKSTKNANNEQAEDVSEYDINEDIDIISDRGDSLRVIHQQQESKIPKDEINGHENLRESLNNARVKAIDGYFIPIHVLETQLSEERVEKELRRSVAETTNHDLDELVHKVCSPPSSDDTKIDGDDGRSHSSNFRRIFGTLVMIGRSSDIQDFIQSGISDMNLPLSKHQLQKLVGTTPGRSRPPVLTGWGPDTIDRFEAQQWELIAPFFSKPNAAHKVGFYQLEQKDVLPFITDESHPPTNETAGGFSTVSKIRIHSSHHDFGNEFVRNGTFALKTLQSRNQNDWAQEVQALQRMTTASQANLVSLLATFRHQERFYLIFPWAEADLRQYWRRNLPPRQSDVDLHSWFAPQLVGLTKALDIIHNSPRELVARTTSPSLTPMKKNLELETRYGRHGDIKPENILWFRDGNQPNSLGTLKISDFGLTKFHASPSGRHIERRTTPTYRAPEYDIHERLTSRAFDIWSLGCVYLEFVTWLLYGFHGLDDKFAVARTMDRSQETPDDSFFVVKKDEKTRIWQAEVKPSVTEWISTLRQEPNTTPFLCDILDIIETQMLVVDPEKRIDASRCVNLLEEASSRLLASHHTKHLALPAPPGPSENEDQDKSTRGGARLLYRSHLGNDITNLRLEELDMTSYRMSRIDQFRLYIEQCCGHEMNWSPLPQLDRRQPTSRARLIWEYAGQEMSIFLDPDQFECYRNRILVSRPGILPTTNPSQNPSTSATAPSHSTRWQSICNTIWKLPQYWKTSSGPKCHAATTQTPSTASGNTRKEAYFCSDKHWTTVKQTNIHTVPSVDSLANDFELFVHLRKGLAIAQGSWMHRLTSWRTCTQIKLSKFTLLFDNNDLVKIFEHKTGMKPVELCKGYDYFRPSDLDLDEHMQIMAEIILQGIQKPELGLGGRTVLNGIPKLQAPPGLSKKQYNSGWGFYAFQGLCLKYILGWVGTHRWPIVYAKTCVHACTHFLAIL